MDKETEIFQLKLKEKVKSIDNIFIAQYRDCKIFHLFQTLCAYLIEVLSSENE